MTAQQSQESLSMVERVARAILKRRYYDCEPEAYGNDVDGFIWKLDPDHIFDANDEARAAIEAMANPTDSMVDAAAGEYVPPGDFIPGYNAAIRAALLEQCS